MKTNNDGENQNGELESSGGAYVRVPLPLLALWNGLKRDALRDNILIYGLMKYAKLIYRTRRKQNGTFGRLRVPKPPPDDFDEDDPKHRSIGKAMVEMALKGGSVEQFFRVWQKAQNFLKRHELLTGQPNFSVPCKLLFDETLKCNDFKVLFAVNSIIGESKYWRMTRKMIASRTAGVKNAGATPEWMGKPLTERQVRWSLEKLQDKGLILRALACNRWTFVAWPGRIRREELIAEVQEWKRVRKHARAAKERTEKRRQAGKAIVV